MAENINFISATELPEATGEEVSVLCLENGEMKQKPANGLGGGIDAVIDLGIYTDTANLSDLNGGSVPAGTVKMIEAKIATGKMPKLKGIIAYQYYDNLEKSIFEFTAVGEYGANQVVCYCDIMSYSGHYSLCAYLRDDHIVGDVDSIYRVEKL